MMDIVYFIMAQFTCPGDGYFTLCSFSLLCGDFQIKKKRTEASLLF